MLTYIYNKYSPVNCIHHLKCSINITHTILVAAKDPRHLASHFNITHYSHVHLLFTIQVTVFHKFSFVWYSAKQGTTHRPTSHLAHLYAVRFLTPRAEQRRQRSRLLFAGQC